MNTQTFELDVSKKSLKMPTLILGQGDKSGTVIRAAIYDNGTPLELANYAVRFSMRLPGGADFYRVTGSKSGNEATFTIDETYAAAVPGTTDVAYVEVLFGSEVVASTGRIHVVVLESATYGAVQGEAYVPQVERLMAQLEEGIANAGAATGRANSAADEANALLEGFSVEYSDLSDDCKERIAALASAGVVFATQEEVDEAFEDEILPALAAGGNGLGKLTEGDYEWALSRIFG